MKGSSPLFGKQKHSGRWQSGVKRLSNAGSTYSYNLKNHIYPHQLPIKGVPNSTVEQRDDNGKVVRIRHYDDKGNAYKDVDYTDHGRPDTHKVPHTHIIDISDGIDRKKGAKPYANR